MTFYPLDTNAVSALLRGDPTPIVQLETCIAKGHRVTLNAVSYYETLRGLTPRHGSKRARFNMMMQEIVILELDRLSLDVAASVYQYLRSKGTILEDADILIAGIALANDAVLVTRNLKHFGRVPGLRLENWEA